MTTTPLPPDLAAKLASEGVDLGAALAGVTGPTTTAKATPKVFWGSKPSVPLPGLGGDRGVPYKAGNTGSSISLGSTEPVRDVRDVDQAKLDILKWSDPEMEDLAQKLIAAGMLPQEYTRMQLETAWENMVDLAARYQEVGKDVSPWDVIDLYGGTNILTGKPTKPTVSTVVQRQATLSDPEEAQRVLNDALSNQLGRRATPQEMDDFTAALNSAQRANPVVNTQTTSTDAKGNTVIDSTATGGVDIAGFTDKYGRTGDHEAEYGHYQAATTYMNALFNAIQSPVG